MLTMDGEQVQIESAMDYRQIFNNHNVHIVKHSASFSKHSNALDAGNVHKATKMRVKCASGRKIMAGQEGLQKFMDDLFAENVPHVPSAMRHKAVVACIRIIMAYAQIVTPDMLDHSFIKAGMNPMKRFSLFKGIKKLTKVQIESIRVAFPALYQIILKNGCFKEERRNLMLSVSPQV